MLRGIRIALLITVVAAIAGCDASSSLPPTVPTRPPTALPSISISPTSARAGSSDLQITITGSNFASERHLSSWATWRVPSGDTVLETTFIDSHQLTATIPAALLVAPVSAEVFVTTADPMGDSHVQGVPAVFQVTNSANGSVTWTSITTQRTLCGAITSQVGSTYPLWLSMQSQGAAVTLSLSHDGPPPYDPRSDEGPAIYTGTLNGGAISASLDGPMGGLSCPADTSITPQTSGQLTATVSGNKISGDYTDVYGAGADQTTFLFHFEASL